MSPASVSSVTLRTAAILMAIALASMILCLVWFSPLTMSLFLALGTTASIASVVLFLASIFASFREHRAPQG
jgi:hypothetical protein